MIVQSTIGLNQEAVAEWIEYRAFKKKPLSQFALDKSINFLLRYPEYHQQMLVDTAIMNDWQGLHHVDPPNNNPTSTRNMRLVDELTDTSWATS